MKVQLLKNHLHHSKGDVIEVTEDRAHYFERTGVAEKLKEENKKEKGSGPAKAEKKKQSGPNG